MDEKIIEKIAFKLHMRPETVEAVTDAVFEEIMDSVSGGDNVRILNFGSFSTRTASAKLGRNPKTGEMIEIGEHRKPVFKAAKGFKNRVR